MWPESPHARSLAILTGDRYWNGHSFASRWKILRWHLKCALYSVHNRLPSLFSSDVKGVVFPQFLGVKILCSSVCDFVCWGGGSDGPGGPGGCAASSGDSSKRFLAPSDLVWTHSSQWNHSTVPPKPDWWWDHFYPQRWAQSLHCDW